MNETARQRLSNILFDELISQVEYGLDALQDAGFTDAEALAYIDRIRPTHHRLQPTGDHARDRLVAARLNMAREEQ